MIIDSTINYLIIFNRYAFRYYVTEVTILTLSILYYLLPNYIILHIILLKSRNEIGTLTRRAYSSRLKMKMKNTIKLLINDT